MLGLISAMYEEMDRVLSQLEHVESQVIGQRTFYRGTFQNQELVLVFSRWGKVAAATTVTQLINTFKVDQIVFSGVAGSIHPQVKVGDIVLANAMVQHDMNASPLFPPTEIPLLEKSVFQPHFDPKLENAIQHFAHQYTAYFSQETLENFGISKPQLHHGKIASGDLFVHSKSQIDTIVLHHPDTLCVEMEGAAVAQVCYEYGIPYQIIRIISDEANANAHVDFPLFAKEVAGKYTLEILKHWFKASSL